VRVTLVALALALVAGCAGSETRDGPATLVVDVNVRGEYSFDTFTLADGRLAPGRLHARRVYARAGDEEPQEGITYEEVYLREPDGTVQRLTDDRRADLAPQLLADGRVAFVSCAFPDDGGPPDCTLDAIDPVGGTRTTLLDDLGVVFAGELSPDERSFLFTPLDPRRGAPTGVFVRSVDGGAARRLVDGYGGRWSPDGERIAFVSDRDRNGRCLFHDCLGHAGELYVADADGGNERRLTGNPEVDGVPTWSGDGEWLLLGRIPDEEADWDLYAVRADGECELQLTDTPRWELGAEWHGGGHGGLSC
jgi:Tol biopolymer transport system component